MIFRLASCFRGLNSLSCTIGFSGNYKFTIIKFCYHCLEKIISVIFERNVEVKRSANFCDFFYKLANAFRTKFLTYSYQKVQRNGFHFFSALRSPVLSLAKRSTVVTDLSWYSSVHRG
jgi:hypothetical protein